MKRLGITVAALWMAGMASAWAQTNAFQVDITGSIVQADGTVIAVKDPSKGVSGLNVTPTDTLVAIVSQDAQSVEVDFVNVASNKIMRTFAGSARSVLLSDGKFVTLLGAARGRGSWFGDEFAGGDPRVWRGAAGERDDQRRDEAIGQREYFGHLE